MSYNACNGSIIKCSSLKHYAEGSVTLSLIICQAKKLCQLKVYNTYQVSISPFEPCDRALDSVPKVRMR